MSGLWEFPGGKIEQGETPEGALKRELKEELGLTIRSQDLRPLTFASHRYPRFHLLMPVFIYPFFEGTIEARENQQLAWLAADEFTSYKMPKADEPLIPLVQQYLTCNSGR